MCPRVTYPPMPYEWSSRVKVMCERSNYQENKGRRVTNMVVGLLANFDNLKPSGLSGDAQNQ